MAAPQSRRTIEESVPSETMDREAEREAAFFVNDRPVTVATEHPTVKQVIAAAGFDPLHVNVFRLSGPSDPGGRPIGIEERLDATPEHPVYLRCETVKKKAATGVAPGSVATPATAGGRSLGIRDLRAPRPRDVAQDPPPTPPGPSAP